MRATSGAVPARNLVREIENAGFATGHVIFFVLLLLPLMLLAGNRPAQGRPHGLNTALRPTLRQGNPGGRINSRNIHG